MVDKVQVNHFVALGNVHGEHVERRIDSSFHLSPVIAILPVIYELLNSRRRSTVVPFFASSVLDIWYNETTLYTLRDPVEFGITNCNLERVRNARVRCHSGMLYVTLVENEL